MRELFNLLRRRQCILTRFVVWACWYGLLVPDQCCAGLIGQFELLDQVQVLHEANFQTIVTWHGEATVDTIDHEGDSVDHRVSKVTFAYRARPSAWVFSWEYTDCNIPIYNGATTGAMYRDNLSYSYIITPAAANIVQGVVISADPLPEYGPMSTVFLPKSFFYIRNGELAKRFANWRSHQSSDWLIGTIERAGPLVLINKGNCKLPGVESRYIFDLSKSGNLIEFVAKDNVREEKWVNEWVNVDGAWVPEFVTYENRRHDGTRLSRRRIDWLSNHVNDKLPDSSFSLEAMGVKEGARVNDIRTGARWIHSAIGEGAKKASDAPHPERSNEWSASRISLVVCLNLLAVAVLVTLFRKRRVPNAIQAEPHSDKRS